MKTSVEHILSKPRTHSKVLGRGENGFSMVELMLVVAVTGILLAVGVPSFRSMITTMRIKNASFDVHSSILAARSEAITRNTSITITPVSGNWANGWTASTAGGVDVKKQEAFNGITVDGPATLVYNSSGRISTANNCTASVCVSLNATGAFPQDGRCVTIDLSGRPLTAKGVCP